MLLVYWLKKLIDYQFETDQNFLSDGVKQPNEELFGVLLKN